MGERVVANAGCRFDVAVSIQFRFPKHPAVI